MAKRNQKAGPTSGGSDPHGFYDAYADYSRTLRTWLVAYGVGAPVLFVSSEHVWKAVREASGSQAIANLFLTGVAVQVVLATVNKAAMWACYFGEMNPEFQNSLRYKVSSWISNRLWIDLICDLATMFLFARASHFVYRIFTTSS